MTVKLIPMPFYDSECTRQFCTLPHNEDNFPEQLTGICRLPGQSGPLLYLLVQILQPPVVLHVTQDVVVHDVAIVDGLVEVGVGCVGLAVLAAVAEGGVAEGVACAAKA